MPEPISSSNRSQSSSVATDPTLDQAGQVCRNDAPNASLPEPVASTPPAVGKLISAVAPAVSVLPPATSSAPAEAQTNAQRTTEQSGVGPYAAAGVTGGARDALFAGAAALKGTDPKTGLEIEVFSASVQAGGENEAQAGMARLGISGKHGNASAEFFTARAHGGAHNDDGSTGVNCGALATIAGIEGTLVSGANSLTLGVAAGVGWDFSAGKRDIDHDGNPELCAKATVGDLTLGLCVEPGP